jgi:hypothetical protein
LLIELHEGLVEELPSVSVLTKKHGGVPLQDLIDAVVSMALACRAERPPGVIDDAARKLCMDAADVLARDREPLAAAWTQRVDADRRRGYTSAQAVELLDKAALGWMTEQQFDDLLFTSTSDPLQQACVVLMRAADTLHHARPTGPAGDEARIKAAVTLRKAAMILAERRPFIPVRSQVTSTAAFAECLSITEDLLRAVKTIGRGPGRPAFTTERRVAGEFVEVIRAHTKRRQTDHAAPLVAVACPALAGWREQALAAARESLYPAQRESLGKCRPHELPRPARARYTDNLGRYLRRLLRQTTR